MLERFVERVDLDCVLLAGRYSLLDRSGGDAPRRSARRVASASSSAACSTPVCSSTPTRTRRTTTRPRPPPCSSAPARLQAVCAAHGIALGAAALQFAMRHPAVTTVLVGARSAAEVALDVGFAATPIPDEVLQEIAGVA